MRRQRVTSREYKIMLRPEKFAGDEAQLLRAAGDFWSDVARATADIVIDCRGTLGGIDKRRVIEFLDTGPQHLKESGYIFRVRCEMGGRRPEVTLKFRHGDRYLAASRRMKGRRLDLDVKFEEDIKAPFVSLYSFSASGPLGKRQVPANLGGVARLFPDLERRVNGFARSEALASVGDSTARELVITGASFRIGRGPKVEAECALIVWYESTSAPRGPAAVEFSFRYGSKSERYGGRAARRAYEVFAALQALDRWIDPHQRTKTAWVYR